MADVGTEPKAIRGEANPQVSFIYLPAGKCDFNEPLLNGHKVLTLVCCSNRLCAQAFFGSHFTARCRV